VRELQQLADQWAGESGLKAKLAQPLAEDADLIRKMKPSLIKARAKGEAPTNQKPGRPTVAPSGPQLGKRRKAKKKAGALGPWIVLGVALAGGIMLAKWIDLRGHGRAGD
jgi:hypothetical protein